MNAGSELERQEIRPTADIPTAPADPTDAPLFERETYAESLGGGIARVERGESLESDVTRHIGDGQRTGAEPDRPPMPRPTRPRSVARPRPPMVEHTDMPLAKISRMDTRTRMIGRAGVSEARRRLAEIAAREANLN